jgi:hypothetical protein
MIFYVIMVILVIYAIVISVLYFLDLTEKDKFQKDTLDSIKNREEELKRRETMVVDKELCFRELTKLKTIQNSILDILSQDSNKSDTASRS